MCASVCGGLQLNSDNCNTSIVYPCSNYLFIIYMKSIDDITSDQMSLGDREWEDLSTSARCVGVSVMEYNVWSVVRPCTHRAPSLEMLCQVDLLLLFTST